MPENNSDKQSTDNVQEQTPPPMNLGEATGRALFQGANASKINHPKQGEAKRSLRLLRLIIVPLIACASIVVAIGFTRHPGLGVLRPVGILAFLAFGAWCFFISYKLWKNLK